MSSPEFKYHFSIEFMGLAVSCLGLGGADVIILFEPIMRNQLEIKLKGRLSTFAT